MPVCFLKSCVIPKVFLTKSYRHPYLDMALVSPYDTALLHEFSRHEAVRLVSESFSSISISSTRSLKQVPLESFFASLPDQGDTTSSAEDGIPSVQACAVHLELLETFMILRRKVLHSNALDITFGITHNGRDDRPLAKRREEKWTKFVNLAVARFAIWVKYVHEDDSRRLANVRQSWSMIPPIDVLMVLHAFMLNPKEYRAYCADANVAGSSMLRLRFPWKAIVGI